MVLKYFLPHENFTFKHLDAMTGHIKGLWTWPMRGAIAIRNLGLRVINIEPFDYQSFSSTPKEYLYAFAGRDVAEIQIQHSDIESEKQNAEEFMQKIELERRQPKYKDIIDLLSKKYLLICNINAKTLNRKRGYIGHFVLVFRATKYNVWLHDPGLPPRKKRRVTRRVFEESWAYPNEDAKNILAFTV